MKTFYQFINSNQNILASYMKYIKSNKSRKISHIIQLLPLEPIVSLISLDLAKTLIPQSSWYYFLNIYWSLCLSPWKISLKCCLRLLLCIAVSIIKSLHFSLPRRNLWQLVQWVFFLMENYVFVYLFSKRLSLFCIIFVEKYCFAQVMFVFFICLSNYIFFVSTLLPNLIFEHLKLIITVPKYFLNLYDAFL